MPASSSGEDRASGAARGAHTGAGSADDLLLCSLPLPEAGAVSLRAALVAMATHAAGAARCEAKLTALEAIRPRRTEFDDDVEACRLARRLAANAREAAHDVLRDVVRSCRVATLPPERVIHLVREMTTAIARVCPGLPFDVATRLDGEVVQWTIAAYYEPE